jgi:arylformamidase
MTISEDMVVYKNLEKKKPKFINVDNYQNATHYETNLEINLHTGTHVDFPLHMIENGKTSDSERLSNYITQAIVYDLTHLNECIKKEDIDTLGIKKGDFVLFKTKNSFDKNFNFEFIYVEKTAAKYLSELGVIGVGIDTLGIERAQKNHETHKYLLEKDIVILEGIQLKDINAGSYQLIALPIKIKSVEASFCRAVLIES